jgi:phosphoribosyl 1,2-cyclic phosphate phosphodiesterase
VLYTHAHADHITGLDDVRLLNRAADSPLDAYGTEATLGELRERFEYAFKPFNNTGFFRPVLVPRPVAPGAVIDVAGLSVRLFDQDHGFIHTLGLRVGGFGYSTDVVALDDDAFEALAGIDTWVVGCYQRAPHRTHAWLDRVLGWVDRLRPRRTILTHMGTDMDWRHLTDTLPSGVEPAHDGQIIDL